MECEDEDFLCTQPYTYGGRRSKTFNDNVHGHVTLHRASVAVIDTPEFQRLRHLKQLGLTYYIYPSASHNRFEHSLGVAHLASEWGRQLLNNRGGPGRDGWQLRALEPEDRQHLTVLQLAGLCHDLGHGPFSHVFERELLPKLFPNDDPLVREWHHENMSNRIFDHIISGGDDGGNDVDLRDLGDLDEDHVGLIKDLMHGSQEPARRYPAAPWLFDVVANKRSGVDVDKFDYLQRDAKMCGVSVQLDPQRLMMFSRLDRDREQVIFKMTEYSNLALGLFGSRAEMHRRVYTHQKVKSVEFMVCDALVLAQEPLGLREAVQGGDLRAYLLLDDSLLQRLQALRPDDHENPAAVRQAQELLRQLARRKLYKFVQEVTVNLEAQKRLGDRLPSADEICGYGSSARNDGVTLRAEDVIVCETHIDQGMRHLNPMAAVRFFQTHDAVSGDAAFTMQPSEVSSMLGTVYQDKKIRVYCKSDDARVRGALKHAFEQWSQRVLNCQVPGTPWRTATTNNNAAAAAAAAAAGAWAAGGPVGGGGGGAVAAALNGWPAPASASGASGDGGGGGAPGGGAGAGAGGGGLLHAGSGGRSRKRSLMQDMAAAASGGGSSLSLRGGCTAAAAGLPGGGGGGGGEQQQQSGDLPLLGGIGSQGSQQLGNGAAAAEADDDGGGGGGNGALQPPPPKRPGSAAGSSGSRLRDAGAASLPGIAEEEEAGSA